MYYIFDNCWPILTLRKYLNSLLDLISLATKNYQFLLNINTKFENGFHLNKKTFRTVTLWS